MAKKKNDRDKAREYKLTTVKRLHTLSGNQCAEPNCSNKIVAVDGTILSNICHIEGANEFGPRYNPGMTDDERRHYDNLILLCNTCHKIIDNKENEAIYTVDVLKDWKANHESIYLQQFNLNRSLLSMAVQRIASADLDEQLSDDSENSSEAFKIDSKIDYNSVKSNKPLLQEYAVYQGKINVIYSELEKQTAL